MVELKGEGFPEIPEQGESFKNLGSGEGFPSSQGFYGRPSDTELTPDMGWEYNYARLNPNTYAALRTAAGFIPYASFAFPSARKEYKEASTLGQTIILGVDAVAFLPAPWIGKGLKVIARPPLKLAKGLVRKITPKGLQLLALEEAPKDLLTGIMRQLDSFVPKNAKTELMRIAKLTDEEAEAIIRGGGKIWQRTGRSGGLLKDFTENTRPFFDKSGLMKNEWKKKIAEWSKTPEKQRFLFEKRLYVKYLKGNLQAKGREILQVFDSQINALYGAENVGKITFKNITDEEMRKVLLDTLINKSAILRRVDSNFGGALLPFRKLAGRWDKLYGTLGLKKKIGDVMGLSNETALQYVTKFQELMAVNGLGEFTAKGIFKEFYSRAEYKAAGQLIRKLDDLQQAGKSTAGLELGYTTNVQRLVRSYQEWTDFMYSEYLKTVIPRTIRNAGLTQAGEDGLIGILSPYADKFNSYITEALAAGNNLDYKTKLGFLNNILGKIRETVKSNASRWLTDPSDKNVSALLNQLSFSKGDKTGIMNYLENYGQRFSRAGSKKGGTGLAKSVTPSFTKQRVLEEAENVTDDLAEMILGRSRQQSRDIFLEPERAAIVEAIKKLPVNLRKHFGHYFDRLTGAQSDVDREVAQFLNKHLKTALTQEQITNLSYRINDLVYLGGIGFKPFSAALNLFQPFITVPADMGGITNYLWLTKGLKRGYSPATRQWIREAGIITEYVPDILFHPKVSNFAKGAWFEKLRDISMWLYRQSDLHNRYITAGAALERWDYHIGKALRSGKLNTGKFLKKLKVSTREPWVREEINRALAGGTREGIEHAKKIYVADVVADTQFLYGSLESPVIGQMYGSISRTAVVFQSWWMNYGSLLEKWMLRSKTTGEAAERMFTWMTSSAISYHIMSEMWGSGTAAKRVGLGPLPTQLDMPATWRPVADALDVALTAASIPMGGATLEDVEKKITKMVKSSMIFIPGGLQINKSWPALKEGDREKLMKSILGLK